MGLVYADIELINADDVALANKHFIGQDEIKSMHVNMLVDSGAYMMAIDESIQAQLQLPFRQKHKRTHWPGTRAVDKRSAPQKCLSAFDG